MIIESLKTVLKSFVTIIFFCIVFSLFLISFSFGYVQGYRKASADTEVKVQDLISGIIEDYKNLSSSITPIPSKKVTLTPTPKVQEIKWGGPELWDEVNKRRTELGVNPLKVKSELCTIASIRLNELLELGKLDNHEGFSNMKERRPDLKWIFDSFSTVAEFLAMGGRTALETVNLWQDTLGHNKLLTGGEYVWGCVYAQNTFAVAIAAY